MRSTASAVTLGIAIGLMLTGCSGDDLDLAVYGNPASTTLEVGVDTCNADPEVTAEESATEVRLSVEVEQSETSGDCRDSVDVELEAPLGDRQVIDDATGDVVDVQPAE